MQPENPVAPTPMAPFEHNLTDGISRPIGVESTIPVLPSGPGPFYRIFAQGPNGSQFEIEDLAEETPLLEVARAVLHAEGYVVGHAMPSLHGVILCLETEKERMVCDAHGTLGSLSLPHVGARFSIALPEVETCTLDHLMEDPDACHALRSVLLNTQRRVGFGLIPGVLGYVDMVCKAAFSAIMRDHATLASEGLHTMMAANLCSGLLLDMRLERDQKGLVTTPLAVQRTFLLRPIDIVRSLGQGQNLVLAMRPSGNGQDGRADSVDQLQSFFVPLADPTSKAFVAYVKDGVEVLSLGTFLNELIALHRGGMRFVSARIYEREMPPCPYPGAFPEVMFEVGMDPRDFDYDPDISDERLLFCQAFLRATEAQANKACAVDASVEAFRMFVFPQGRRSPSYGQGRPLKKLEDAQEVVDYVNACRGADIEPRILRESLGLPKGPRTRPDSVVLVAYDHLRYRGRAPARPSDGEIEGLLLKQAKASSPASLVRWLMDKGHSEKHREEVLEAYEGRKSDSIPLTELIYLLEMRVHGSPLLGKIDQVLSSVRRVDSLAEEGFAKFDRLLQSRNGPDLDFLLEFLHGKMELQSLKQPDYSTTFTVLCYRAACIRGVSKDEIWRYMESLNFQSFYETLLLGVLAAGIKLPEEDWRRLRTIFNGFASSLPPYKLEVYGHAVMQYCQDPDAQRRLLGFIDWVDLDDEEVNRILIGEWIPVGAQGDA